MVDLARTPLTAASAPALAALLALGCGGADSDEPGPQDASFCEADSLYCSGAQVLRCDLEGASSTLALDCANQALFDQCACGGCSTDRTLCELSVTGTWTADVRHVGDRCLDTPRPCAMNDLGGPLVRIFLFDDDVEVRFFTRPSAAGEVEDDDRARVTVMVGDTECETRGAGDPGGTVFYSTVEPGADARVEVDLHFTCDEGATWQPLRIEGTLAVS